MQLSKQQRRFLKGAAVGASFVVLYVVLAAIFGNGILTDEALVALGRILILPAAPGVLLMGYTALPFFVGAELTLGEMIVLLLLAIVFNALIYGIAFSLFGWMVDQRKEALAEIKK